MKPTRVKKDWLDGMNQLAEEREHDDRMLLEELILWLNTTPTDEVQHTNQKLGDLFLRWYSQRK